MERDRTALADFIQYINEHKRSSVRARLLHVLKVFSNISLHGKRYFLEDFSEEEFCKIRNAGVKTWKEFEILRTDYLLEKPKKTETPREECIETVDDPKEEPRIQQILHLRADISKALEKIDDGIAFVENALVNEFNRMGIKIE